MRFSTIAVAAFAGAAIAAPHREAQLIARGKLGVNQISARDAEVEKRMGPWAAAGLASLGTWLGGKMGIFRRGDNTFTLNGNLFTQEEVSYSSNHYFALLLTSSIRPAHSSPRMLLISSATRPRTTRLLSVWMFHTLSPTTAQPTMLALSPSRAMESSPRKTSSPAILHHNIQLTILPASTASCSQHQTPSPSTSSRVRPPQTLSLSTQAQVAGTRPLVSSRCKRVHYELK